MTKNYLIKMTRKSTGEYILSHTDNPSQRVKRLSDSVTLLNEGAFQKVHDRFNIFKGCSPDADIDFDVYKKM